MSFDCSRFGFRPWKDFLGVVMQQGRVQLDADWNELVSEFSRRLQAGTLDTFGRAVVPRETPDGFLITAASGALSIGVGRLYVDGILAENHGDPTGELVFDRRLAETTGVEPTPFFAQPYLSFNETDLPASNPGHVFNRPAMTGGPHLVYLDVWQREVTYLQEPELIEKAIGIDTTARLQTVWQVKLLANVGAGTTCSSADDLEAWHALTRPSGARLTTSTGDLPDAPNPCQLPPAAGYKGLENQLYRIEIHRGGPLGTATFKWSRDNATVVSRVTAIPTLSELVVESVGRDDFLRFSDGDWVELLDDWHELHGRPGVLRQIRIGGGVDDATRTLTLEAALPAGLFPVDAQGEPDPRRHLRVRRWDQAGTVRREDGSVFHDFGSSGVSEGIPVPAAGTRLFLENGILVQFALAANADDPTLPLEFKSGDAWAVAARATDGTIELLDRAPPRSIHHHYTRLAVVTFPGTASDCRTLWPPSVEGESCDCTVCVSPESHNQGTGTIQQAIDALVSRGGGTICLDVGSYELREPLRIEGARSLRVRGQGSGTVLRAAFPGTACRIEASIGVGLERFSMLGSAREGADTAVVSVSNCVGLRVEEVLVVGLPARAASSIAFGLSGYSLGAVFDDCVLAATRGVADGGGERKYLLTAELRVSDSLLVCLERGVSFAEVSLHYGSVRVENNLIVGCRESGVVATGAVLPGSSLRVRSNVLYVTGSGVQAGTDGLRIEDNQIAGLVNASTGEGIAIVPGLDPSPIDDLRIIGNDLLNLGGHGIALRAAIGSGMIKSNSVRNAVGGGLVMEDDASADYLVIENNHFVDIGTEANENSDTAFVGLQILSTRRADVLSNVFLRVARAAVGNRSRVALLAADFEQLRVAGNRLDGIGPPVFAGTTSALRFLSPFGHLAVESNSTDRADRTDEELSRAAYQVLRVGRFERDPTGGFGLLGAFAYVPIELRAFLITRTRLRARAVDSSEVAVSNNQLVSRQSVLPAIQIQQVQTCLFGNNHCQLLQEPDQPIVLARVQAEHVNASHNRLRGPGKFDTLELDSTHVAAVANISSGKILQNGATLPAPWGPLNLIGV
jgi:hypothetical protein